MKTGPPFRVAAAGYGRNLAQETRWQAVKAGACEGKGFATGQAFAVARTVGVPLWSWDDAALECESMLHQDAAVLH